MKGDLAMTFVVFVVIAIVVILLWYLWLQLQKGTVDVVAAQNILRNCCTDRSIYDCIDPDITYCNVPWSDNAESVTQLATRSQIDLANINDFCGCR